MEALVEWVARTNGILHTQHAEFQLSRSEREANLEVCCGWDDYINHSSCFHRHLDQGFHVGFVGTSDGHRRTPGLGGGLTGVWVREFTLAGILEALRRRRCFATAGARIGLVFRLNEAFMGEEVRVSAPPVGRIWLDAPRAVERVEVIGDGNVVAVRERPSRQCALEFPDLPMCAWYYAKVALRGGCTRYPANIAPAEGPWAWSSPVFREAE